MYNRWAWCLPPGHAWEPVVLRLLWLYERAGIEYEVHQVKQKFGGLRLYVGFGEDVPDHYRYMVDGVELACNGVCEDCGSTSNVYKQAPKGWVFTRCKECWTKSSTG